MEKCSNCVNCAYGNNLTNKIIAQCENPNSFYYGKEFVLNKPITDCKDFVYIHSSLGELLQNNIDSIVIQNDKDRFMNILNKVPSFSNFEDIVCNYIDLFGDTISNKQAVNILRKLTYLLENNNSKGE